MLLSKLYLSTTQQLNFKPPVILQDCYDLIFNNHICWPSQWSKGLREQPVFWVPFKSLQVLEVEETPLKRGGSLQLWQVTCPVVHWGYGDPSGWTLTKVHLQRGVSSQGKCPRCLHRSHMVNMTNPFQQMIHLAGENERSRGTLLKSLKIFSRELRWPWWHKGVHSGQIHCLKYPVGKYSQREK